MVFSGGWALIFCNRIQKGSKRLRIFIVGEILVTISLFSLLSSCYYITATTTKITEVIVSSVIILFINTLDEEMFVLLGKVYPDKVREEIEFIKTSYADMIENDQPNFEESNFSRLEEENSETVGVEHEEEV